MSTYLYLRCEDHDPPLVADSESGQHLYDLPTIRADIADREALVRITRGREEYIDLGDHFRNNTASFLAAHQKCRIGIVDEYGADHPVDHKEAPDGR